MTENGNRIDNWPVADKPREKLTRQGAEHLSSAELLAILLSSGTAKMNALDIGKSLIRRFQNLDNLATASLKELQETEGIGPAKAVILQAAFQLSRNMQGEQAESSLVYMRNPADVARLFIPRMAHLKQEVFAIALLDSAGKYMHSRDITKGIINASLVHPREVFRTAIREAAAAIILIHNHPSGQLNASTEDLAITRQLVETGDLIGIPVRDHLIIAGNAYTSLRETGQM